MDMDDKNKEKQYELNRSLYEACISERIDFQQIGHLLSVGAEPLGIIGLGDSNVYDEVVEEMLIYHDKFADLYDITKIFLDHGMVLSNPPEPYNDDSLHPLWSFAFDSDYRVMDTLQLLLDSGISADDAGQCWGHIVTDIWLCGGIKTRLDNGGIDFFAEDLHKLILIASYSKILSEDENLQKFIWKDKNSYDPCNFREWRKFNFQAKVDGLTEKDKLYGAFILVIDENGNEVWNFRFGE